MHLILWHRPNRTDGGQYLWLLTTEDKACWTYTASLTQTKQDRRRPVPVAVDYRGQSLLNTQHPSHRPNRAGGQYLWLLTTEDKACWTYTASLTQTKQGRRPVSVAAYYYRGQSLLNIHSIPHTDQTGQMEPSACGCLLLQRTKPAEHTQHLSHRPNRTDGAQCLWLLTTTQDKACWTYTASLTQTKQDRWSPVPVAAYYYTGQSLLNIHNIPHTDQTGQMEPSACGCLLLHRTKPAEHTQHLSHRPNRTDGGQCLWLLTTTQDKACWTYTTSLTQTKQDRWSPVSVAAYYYTGQSLLNTQHPSHRPNRTDGAQCLWLLTTTQDKACWTHSIPHTDQTGQMEPSACGCLLLHRTKPAEHTQHLSHRPNRTDGAQYLWLLTTTQDKACWTYTTSLTQTKQDRWSPVPVAAYYYTGQSLLNIHSISHTDQTGQMEPSICGCLLLHRTKPAEHTQHLSHRPNRTDGAQCLWLLTTTQDKACWTYTASLTQTKQDRWSPVSVAAYYYTGQSLLNIHSISHTDQTGQMEPSACGCLLLHRTKPAEHTASLTQTKQDRWSPVPVAAYYYTGQSLLNTQHPSHRPNRTDGAQCLWLLTTTQDKACWTHSIPHTDQTGQMEPSACGCLLLHRTKPAEHTASLTQTKQDRWSPVPVAAYYYTGQSLLNTQHPSHRPNRTDGAQCLWLLTTTQDKACWTHSIPHTDQTGQMEPSACGCLLLHRTKPAEHTASLTQTKQDRWSPVPVAAYYYTGQSLLNTQHPSHRPNRTDGAQCLWLLTTTQDKACWTHSIPHTDQTGQMEPSACGCLLLHRTKPAEHTASLTQTKQDRWSPVPVAAYYYTGQSLLNIHNISHTDQTGQMEPSACGCLLLHRTKPAEHTQHLSHRPNRTDGAQCLWLLTTTQDKACWTYTASLTQTKQDRWSPVPVAAYYYTGQSLLNTHSTAKMRGAMVWTITFQVYACHLHYSMGCCFGWALNFQALVRSIFWRSSLGMFSGYSGFLLSFSG